MIRPLSEIEYPPSEAARAKASMLARMEALQASSNALIGVIAERIGAERLNDAGEIEKLTTEQQRIIANMKVMALR